MTKQTELQLNAIQEYMDSVADYHEATLLVAEMRARLVEAIAANKKAGIANPDPLSAILGLNSQEDNRVVERVAKKVTINRSSNGAKPTRNSPRNSPGMTKKAVYDALPGGVSAISSRTGLRKEQISSAVADLVNAGLVDKHGTHGNTTYTVRGEKKEMTAKDFASIHYHTLIANSN